jgi:hypothetical protein
VKGETATLTGRFTVMPLEELLQWLDQSARSGVLTILRPDGYETWISVRGRHAVAASPPVLEGSLAGGGEAERVAACMENLLDLFLVGDARFLWDPRALTPERAIPLDHPLGFLAMEGLRLLDEWPKLDATYADEGAPMRRLDASLAGSPVLDAIAAAAGEGLSLGEARLRLGLSRAAMLRRTGELVNRGVVSIDGATVGVDPVAALLAQASTLLAEAQYAEASLVFRSLLASDPLDSRARQLLARAERFEAQELSRTLPPDALVRRGKSGTVTGHAASVLDVVGEGRPVAFVLVASPLREVETLRTLAQLAKTGHVRIEAARATRGGT